jgi:hypothetical protein
MNWRRVMYRLWAALSVIWAVTMVVAHSVSNASTQHLRAEFGPAGYLLFVAAYAFGPPAVIYATVPTVSWIITGFKYAAKWRARNRDRAGCLLE